MTAAALTRFAPAPTGFLHLGHVVNAIFVWGLARRFGADVLLRIEDHDAQRSRASFETALLDDLDWLGFVPDRYPTGSFRAGACLSRQSNRHHVYAAAAQHLRRTGRLYACTCSRRAIAEYQRSSPSASATCPGQCRTRARPLDTNVTWRVHLDGGDATFVDLLHGKVTCAPASAPLDPAVRDRHGNWTYTFAVVVDDFDQGVTLVVRGDDLLDATPVQLQLARLLGRTHPPLYAHHRLVMKSATQKLSKADGDSGVADLRRSGWTAPRVIGHAAELAGLAPAGCEMTASAAASLLVDVQLASACG